MHLINNGGDIDRNSLSKYRGIEVNKRINWIDNGKKQARLDGCLSVRIYI